MKHRVSIDRSNLENFLLQRTTVVPEEKASWERETIRGFRYSFGEYKLKIKLANGEEGDVLVQEDCSMIAARVWDSAVFTSKWIEYIATQGTPNPDLKTSLGMHKSISNQRPIQVLELGAGTGMLSVCLAKMGAAVMSTEYGSALKYTTQTCEKNSILWNPQGSEQKTLMAGKVTCRELDWYTASETLDTLFQPNEEAKFDLILVTDCSLTNKESKGVLDMVSKYGTKGHTQCVVGICKEREGTPYFLERAAKEFNNFNIIPSSNIHPNYQSNRQMVLEFQA